MSSTHLVRWSGAVLIIGGLLSAIAFLFHPFEPTLSVMSGPRWLLSHSLTGIGFLLIAPGLAGLYLYLEEKNGIFGFVAFVVASIGCALTAGLLLFIESVLLPVAASNPAFSVLADPAGDVYQSTLALPLFLADIVIFALGFVLLGIAVLRSGNLPRFTGYLIIVGGVLAGLDMPPLPKFISITGIFLLGVGLASAGYALWTATHQTTVGSKMAVSVSS